MKTIILGAAGLLLSGTALAGVATMKSADSAAATAPVAAKDADGLGGSLIANAITIDWPTKAAGEAKARDDKAIGAAFQTPEAPVAETPSTSVMSDAESATDDMVGVGGPDEPVETAALAPATHYPPCRNSADDKCIQLGEPGVRAALASWQASHDPAAVQAGMGGPEEVVDDTAPVATPATSYPPCRSRADDRCIQLGENETLASVAMGGPEEPVETAAYEPLPEDAVMPASEDLAKSELPASAAESPTAI
ncbi:hypothetical protein [Sphingosinicella sp.]|uniref:hypothetical protein n=1 Tax=Sphingosinicella sp. TaxID=1917971 RepID=UPI0040378085